MIEIFNLLLLINSGEIYVDAAKDNCFHCMRLVRNYL